VLALKMTMRHLKMTVVARQCHVSQLLEVQNVWLEHMTIGIVHHVCAQGVWMLYVLGRQGIPM
jgi:hypothetical protein